MSEHIESENICMSEFHTNAKFDTMSSLMKNSKIRKYLVQTVLCNWQSIMNLHALINNRNVNLANKYNFLFIPPR